MATLIERVLTLNERGLDPPFIAAILDITTEQVAAALVGDPPGPQQPTGWIEVSSEGVTKPAVDVANQALLLRHPALEPTERRFVAKVPASGGPNLTFIDAGQGRIIDAVVVDGAYIYWTAHTVGKVVIGRALLDGSGVQPEWVKVAEENAHIFEIAALDGKLYFAWELEEDEWVGRVNVDGTGLEPHWLPFGASLSITDTVASDGTYLFFGYEDEIAKKQFIGRITPDGSVLWRFSPPEGRVQHLACSGGNVYWVRQGGIGRIRTDGSFPEPGWLGIDGPERAIALLASYYYLCSEEGIERGKIEA